MESYEGVEGGAPTLRKAGARGVIAKVLTEALQPFVVLTALLLLVGGRSGDVVAGLVGVAFVTALPLAGVLFAVKAGALSDHHVSQRSQRLPVFAGVLVSMAIGCVVLLETDAPPSTFAVVVAAVVSALFLAAVSHVWKISVHMHCLAASIVIAATLFGPTAAALCLLLPPLAWARVYLQAHTRAQVVVGAATGALVPGAVFVALTAG